MKQAARTEFYDMNEDTFRIAELNLFVGKVTIKL
jgi:hypothetical protein